MILGKYKDEWVDVTGDGQAFSCRVRNGACAWAIRNGFAEYACPVSTWLKRVDCESDIRFFPEIRYRGVRVMPVAWHPTATDPILRIDVDPYDEDLSTKYFRRSFVGHIERCQALRDDGWDVYNPREGAWKEVHVDELEKIEGPPPEGAF